MELLGEHPGIRDSLALAGVAEGFLREYLRLAPAPGENPLFHG